jgi:hypothetical protein
MLYKPDLDEVVERYRRYWLGQMRDEVMVMTTLADQAYIDPWKGWPSMEDTFERFDAYFKSRAAIYDDTIPVALPGLGFGTFGGFFGASVTLESFSSVCKPYDSIDIFRRLEFDPQNYWVRRQLEMVEYFCEKSRGKFAVAAAETVSGVNVLYALRGPEVFADLLEDPEACLHALDVVRSAGIWLLEQQRKIIGSYRGGVFDHWQVWLENSPVWISVDMNSLCSPEFYRRFGRDDTQKFINHFGGGWIHVHKPTGLYLLPEIARNTNVVGIELLHDLGSLHTCFEGLAEIRKQVPGGILVDCDYTDFSNQLRAGTLPTNIIYEVKNCPAIEAANEIARAGRAFRKTN